MTVRELRVIIGGLPQNMPVSLLDLSTDDSDDMNYMLKREDFEVMEYHDTDESSDTYGQVKGKALYICFDNKLNENPITDL